jgi:Fe2+ transport system protein FeoA
MIEGFDSHILPARKSQLQAFGLVPGYWVEVIQQSPVTVVKIEHSELAMESDLARQVLVVDMTQLRYDKEQDRPDSQHG